MIQEPAMQKFSVFITYNSVGRNLSNGWQQHGDRMVYVGQGFLRKDRSSPDLQEKALVLQKVWNEMLKQLHSRNLDLSQAEYLVINCGKCPNLAIRLVELQLQSKSFAGKFIFVHCGCGGRVEPRLHQLLCAGFISAACGGIETMQRIFESYLNKGGVDCFTTVEEMLRPKGI